MVLGFICNFQVPVSTLPLILCSYIIHTKIIYQFKTINSMPLVTYFGNLLTAIP